MRDPIFNRPVKDPLLRACMKGDAAELERLLSQGPAPADFVPLADYAMPKPAVLEALLNHGLEPNLNLNEYKESLAMRSIVDGNRESFHLLVQRGARIDSRDKWGSTLLHAAAGAGQPEIAEFLLGKGIDVNIRQDSKSTPFFQAARNNQVRLMEILFAHGADIEVRDINEQTPVIIAAQAGKFEAVQWLVQHKAKLDARDRWDKTGLAWAHENKRTQIVELLQSAECS